MLWFHMLIKMLLKRSIHYEIKEANMFSASYNAIRGRL